ncbi:twin-arginine translocation signal domain-containing protein [Thiorhodococcus mannitoliphagus]|uniref:Twin-arginine translocation signal domain-containing protein n=1 Tax=Thiorhodococcus mannitoliphagus TaxID=329406 RepID=A0A6P1DYX2_9GAMM|nr:twin-arginine translocation signal domain-containing protein [Thiorhodococcus mannitoliphagus]NEX22680.1 twin-arginine translocation signal domain-containing protein [Thiorhodococcus mannitoliphagus]
MAKSDSKTALDAALEQVPASRREFLKRVLGGTAVVAALPLISTEAAAQPPLPFGIGKGIFAAGAAKGVVRAAPAGKGGGGPYYGGKGGGGGSYAGKGGGGGGSYTGKGGGGGSSAGKGGGSGGSGGGKGGR